MTDSTAQTIPNRPDAMTPAWLTAQLRKAGRIRTGAVGAVEFEPLGLDAIFNAQMVRLRLRYAPDGEQGPSTLVAKLPTAATRLRENAAVFQPGAKEVWFYRHGAAHTPVDTPACYFCAVDPRSGGPCLLLADLAPATSGDWATGATAAQAGLAMQVAARLHGAWWGVDLADHTHPPPAATTGGDGLQLVQQLFAAAWPHFLARWSDPLPPAARRLGDLLAQDMAPADALLDNAPVTLAHGDFRLDNLLFGAREGDPACWVIDWEDVMVTTGMLDVAWFVGGCVDLTGVEAEGALLRAYLRSLHAAGVAGYGWEQAWQDYRGAMVSGFVQGILTVANAAEDAAGRRLAAAVGRRFVQAAARLELDTLVT